MITEHDLGCLDLGASCRCHAPEATADAGAAWLWERRPALPATITTLRRLVRRWAAATVVDEEVGEAIVLAVDEAVTNVVEHAYRDAVGTVGEVQLLAAPRPCRAEVAVLVEDYGTWSTPAAHPGFRGRGLVLMRELADQHTVTRTGAGTTVRMCWRTLLVG